MNIKSKFNFNKSMVFIGALLLCTVLLTACPGSPYQSNLWSFYVANVSQAEVGSPEKVEPTCEDLLKLRVSSADKVIYESPLIKEQASDSQTKEPEGSDKIIPVTIEVFCLAEDNTELGYSKYTETFTFDQPKVISAVDAKGDPGFLSGQLAFAVGSCIEAVEHRGINLCVMAAGLESN
ncbi:MAG: hypothetical protein KC422_21375 [Trueperaceae bacterium]|nr:hypothetical protein [Trueperaceae bacterium]